MISNEEKAGYIFKSSITTIMQLKFDLTKVWTHDVQIIDNTFHALETLIIITEPSDISVTLTKLKSPRTTGLPFI